MIKLTTATQVEWMNNNHASFTHLQSRIQESGMTVPISECLREIEYASDKNELDSARTSLRIACKDGLYLASKELKAEIQKHIKLI